MYVINTDLPTKSASTQMKVFKSVTMDSFTNFRLLLLHRFHIAQSHSRISKFLNIATCSVTQRWKMKWINLKTIQRNKWKFRSQLPLLKIQNNTANLWQSRNLVRFPRKRFSLLQSNYTGFENKLASHSSHNVTCLSQDNAIEAWNWGTHLHLRRGYLHSPYAFKVSTGTTLLYLLPPQNNTVRSKRVCTFHALKINLKFLTEFTRTQFQWYNIIYRVLLHSFLHISHRSVETFLEIREKLTRVIPYFLRRCFYAPTRKIRYYSYVTCSLGHTSRSPRMSFIPSWADLIRSQHTLPVNNKRPHFLSPGGTGSFIAPQHSHPPLAQLLHSTWLP
jgi:hypothetical protein